MKTNVKPTLLIILCILLLQGSLLAQKKNTGVLILAHGGNEMWDNTVEKATLALKNKYIVETAFGMADPVTMQAGIDRLESQGAEKIVVVPLFISSYSIIMRQNEYLLGLRNKLADPPMIMSHGHGGMSAGHGSHGGASNGGNPQNEDHSTASGNNHGTAHGSHSMTMSADHNKNNASSLSREERLPQLKIKAKVFLTSALDDNHFVTDIIYDRIAELSKNPSNETVLIVGHGPLNEEDNIKWVQTIESIADHVREKEAGKGNHFKQIFSLTVRDDNDSAVYNQAKEHFRSLVYQSGKSGDVIVIPLLLSQGGIENGYVKRLEGLNYKWSGKTLLPDAKITSFIEESVANALK